MNRYKVLGITVCFLVGMMPAVTSAVTVDFAGNSGVWGVGGSSISSGNVTVMSTGGDITWENDGLGVSGGSENDEIDNGETLLVTFAIPSFVTSIWLDDFWNATNSNSPEQARVTINGGPSFVFNATKPFNSAPDPTTFDFTLNFTDPVSSLLFEAVNLGDPSNLASDYALARIDFQPVPVPPSVWLLGSALVFLFRKRQTS